LLLHCQSSQIRIEIKVEIEYLLLIHPVIWPVRIASHMRWHIDRPG
jgi:hypothetical protein